MNALPDPTKKTSIISLLNPQEASGYPAHLPPLGPAPVQGPSQLHPYDTNYSPTSFNLRAASWETPGDSRKSMNAPPVHHSYHQPPYVQHRASSAYSYSPSRSEGSRIDDGRSHFHRESSIWRPSTQHHQSSDSSSMSYSHIQSNERTALSGDYSNTPNSYIPSYTGPPNTSEWQSGSRASVRIAAKGTVPTTYSQTTHDDRHDQHYYGHPQDVYNSPMDNYPPQQQEIEVGPPSVQPESGAPTASVSSTSSSSKRKESEGGVASAPKPKRPRPKAKTTGSETPSSSTAGASKRGYNAKKRSEAALISAQNDALQRAQLERPADSGPNPATSNPPPVSLIPELQFARCMSNRYRNEAFPRCVSCTRRWAGDTCRFQGIRYFMRDAQRQLYGISFTEHHSQQTPSASLMDFPTKWNRRFEKEHIVRTKVSIAKALLPTLLLEQEHLKVDQIVRRPRECDVRATCDTCMTSLFSSSFMCRLCGREVCNECYQQVKTLTYKAPNATPAELSALAAKRERFTNANPHFLICTKRNDHGVEEFTPVTRFIKAELDQSIKEMQEILDKEEQTVQASNPSEISDRPPAETAASVESSHPILGESLPPISSTSPPPQAEHHTQVHSFDYSNHEEFPNPLTSPIYDDYTPPNAAAHILEIPINRLQIIPASLYDQPGRSFSPTGSTSPVFSDLWRKGLPLLVKGLLPRFKISWTPQYFIERYGDQGCLVVECQMDTNKRIYVKDFFGWFGKYEGRNDCWKLKDWPPTADFKNTFPELYEDFSQAVPVPDYVRRDGVYNIGSHFPSNTVKPDLGPKMYNSMASSQEAGSKGSTRLHMDMADAFNVMLYAEPCADGTEGYAVWDLYPAEDSDKIRAFLKKRFLSPNTSGNSKSTTAPAPVQVQMVGHDPIHGQQFYLDVELRKALFEEYGVKSYRVYQRPGDGVFIPAGCAHQVANMSDCVKIAVDFVSPENIDRCQQLTKEFREQNQSKVWKEDVLQLRTMMWFAWQSCSLREEELKKEAARAAGGMNEDRNENAHGYRTIEGRRDSSR